MGCGAGSVGAGLAEESRSFFAVDCEEGGVSGWEMDRVVRRKGTDTNF